jgi:coatomer protein complex subunit epsilon
MAANGPDALFAVHNNFYLGAYQAAINEAESLTGLGATEATERDCFMYRSYLAQGSYQLPISEISEDAPTALQAVKLLAQYLSDEGAKDTVISTLGQWLTDPACANNTTLALMATSVYQAEGNLVDALKCCHSTTSLELMAMSVQLFIKMDRPDVAEKKLKDMMAIDEDATCTQLAQAWVNLALGGNKVQEAFYIFQELGDKYTWTTRLHNGSAVCSMHMRRYDEAEKELLEALAKDSKDADTLANLVVVTLHLGKPSSRYLNQLKASDPNHASLKRTAQFEEAFDRAAQGFSI